MLIDSGIDDTQREMLSLLLDGNVDAAKDQMLKNLQNPEYLETVRQQLLENPEALSAMGISESVLSNPQEWAQLLETGLGELLESNDDLSSSNKKQKRRRFAS